MKINVNFTKREKSEGEMISVTGPLNQDWARQTLKKYVGVQTQLAAYGCIAPPFDPYMLMCYSDKNGYHSTCMHLKKNMSVGKGWDADPELLAWLDGLQVEEGLPMFFQQFAIDMEMFGYAAIEVAEGVGTWALYNMPTAEVRVKPQTKNTPVQYVQYNYVSREDGLLLGWRYETFDDFQPGVPHGVRLMRLPSKRRNFWYSEPEYVSCIDLLSMNVSIVDFAKKFFTQGMMADMLLVAKGVRLGPKKQQALRDYFASNFRGMVNAHRIGFIQINEDEAIDKIDMNGTIDRGFGETRRDNRDEIVASHLMPPRLVGIISAGSIGGTGEVEGQLKIVKTSLIDPRQVLYEGHFQRLFRDMGAPAWKSFRFKPLDVSAGSTDVAALSQAAGGAAFITTQEAHDEWDTEKSANSLINNLRNLRKELNNG